MDTSLLFGNGEKYRTHGGWRGDFAFASRQQRRAADRQ
jgi:hypothetical protein